MNTTNNDPGIRLPETIHRPELQTRMQRSIYAVLSTIGWLVWLYLFAPLVSALAWLFGYERFNQYVLNNTSNAMHTLVVYVVIIGAAGLAFVLWATYNLFRFRGVQRRAAAQPATLAEVARINGISEQAVTTIRRAKVQRVHHDEHGQITETEVLDGITPAKPMS
jgi:poly-beta-1,6-N-acetyl-D-glucosamine biosynthesis protein PgaD